MLLMRGEDDPLCPAEGSRAFFETLGVEGCRLEIYPGLRHEIFNEPEREAVLDDLIDWIESVQSGAGRVAPGPGAAGPGAGRVVPEGSA